MNLKPTLTEDQMRMHGEPTHALTFENGILKQAYVIRSGTGSYHKWVTVLGQEKEIECK